MSRRPCAPGPMPAYSWPRQVNQIVLALRARPRVVGNLVGRQAKLRADVLRHIIKCARDILVGHLELARGMQAEGTASPVRW